MHVGKLHLYVEAVFVTVSLHSLQARAPARARACTYSVCSYAALEGVCACM